MLITCSPSFSCVAQQFRLSQHAAHLHSKNTPFENLKLSHTAAACFALKKKLQRRIFEKVSMQQLYRANMRLRRNPPTSVATPAETLQDSAEFLKSQCPQTGLWAFFQKMD
jgi:hypothetical protein